MTFFPPPLALRTRSQMARRWRLSKVQGNKRASIALGAYFLELNGYGFIVKKFVLEMENIAVWLADGKISKDLLRELIQSLLFESDFSESLKLKLTHALENVDTNDL